MKSLLKLFVALALFWMVAKFCHQQTDGFQIAKIISSVNASTDWDVPAQDLELLKAIFSQPFTFLDSGGQCYVFISKDGRLVLKLFKMHHLNPYAFLFRPFPGLTDHLRLRYLLFRKQQLDQVFSSSKLAFIQLKKETGLLFMNLNPSDQEIPLTLIDKLGIAHHLNLAHIPFVLQFRADNPFHQLRLHLKHQELDAAKQVIKTMTDCLIARYQKGIRDHDPALRRNLGLLKDRAIALDIGSFYISTPLSSAEQQQELFQETRRMRQWLQKRSPALADYLDSLIENVN